MRKYLMIPLLLATFAACPGSSKPASAPAPEWKPSAELTARLAFLEPRLEQARVANHIPGMAIAVVAEGRMVYAKGFGVADIDAGTAVTPETIFAIGSTTKAFTSTLAAMMVDEGKMSWDEPLSELVPGLQLHIDSDKQSDVATVRDALCHRTGFSRMGVLFAAGTLTRDEIFTYASKAEPFAPYRSEFLYNNITYLAAGVATANAAGTTWEDMVTQRILEPLGMTDTTVSYAGAHDDPRRSKGYSYYADLDTHKPEEMRNIDVVAPAGSINSNVTDMAKWVRLQLGGGEVDGTRLVSAEQLAVTHEPHMTIAPGVDYGLGWMLHDWRGHAMLEHGGNIDGYAASVGMIPELGVGYVLLTNVSATALQQSGLEIVFDAMVGDSYKGRDASAPADNLEDYAGTYIAKFAPVMDTPITVLVQDDKLAVDVPGQMVFELLPPDADGKRQFAVTDQISVSFERDAAGNVVLMRLHQAGFDFELPREGAPFDVEVTEEQAAPLLGTYVDQAAGTSVQIVLYRGRLAVSIPDMGVFQLDPPDADGTYVVRSNRAFHVTFELGADGVATAITVVTDASKRLVRTEVAAAASGDGMAEVQKLRAPKARAAAIAKLGLVAVVGKVRIVQAGVDGAFAMYYSGTDRYRQEVDLGKVGWMVSVANTDSAWGASAFDEPEQLEGDLLAQALLQHPAGIVGDLSALYTSITYLRADVLDGAEVHVVSATAGSLPKSTLYIDATTGDIVQVDAVELSAFSRTATTTKLSDYREVGGIRIPFKIVSSNNASGTTEFIVDTITSLAEDPGDLFPPELPADPGLSHR